MDLDELKALWKDTDRRLGTMEPALRLNLRLAQAGTLDRTRSALRGVRLALWYEVGAGAVVALLAGSYLAGHIGTLRFALPAAALQLAAILTLGAAARQLVALQQIDYTGPVLTIQRRLADLGVRRAWSNRWLVLSSPLLWALLVVVVPHGLFGIDAYRALGWRWLGANLAFGLVVLGGAAWAGRRAAAGSRCAAVLRWVGDDVTGRRVARASGILDDVAAFEAEERA